MATETVRGLERSDRGVGAAVREIIKRARGLVTSADALTTQLGGSKATP